MGDKMRLHLHLEVSRLLELLCIALAFAREKCNKAFGRLPSLSPQSRRTMRPIEAQVLCVVQHIGTWAVEYHPPLFSIRDRCGQVS